MVGVPGKYRGCETCRSRRVKCGNEKPFCKRCTDSNRDCTYERETVFIVASIEDGGRCSSHPPRKTGKKGKAASKVQEEKLELITEEPLAPAWSDLISVSNLGKRYTLQLAALHTSLQSVVRSPRDDDSDEGSSSSSGSAPLSFTPYQIPDVQPSPSEDDFEVRSKSLVHFSPPDNISSDETQGIKVDGIFLFLYQHNNSISSSLIPSWRDPNAIRKQGPETFRLFPNHHFFVRVYRHNAICAALLNHKRTFLSEPPWITAPWEIHQKTTFDHLLDAIVLLPELLQRADHIFSLEQTLARRLKAQDLLINCINTERDFDQWYAAATAAGAQPQHQPSPPQSQQVPQVAGEDGEGDDEHLFWIEDPSDHHLSVSDAMPRIPFADSLAFRDGLTAVAFIYYWMALLRFYPCVERLYRTVFEPVVDGPFPQTVPVLPAALASVDPRRYGPAGTRALASNICRSFDFALARTVQPDMLAAPLFAVCQFYQLGVGMDYHQVVIGGAGGLGGLGAEGEDVVFGDGRLELMWCEAFRARLVAKGREMQDVVQGKQWREMATAAV